MAAKTKPKPRKQKLKLFRTPAGFHDAYVAAASRKAALAAWGAETDLFSAGIAQQVDDPTLLREASERSGEVIKRKRGTAQEWREAKAAKKEAGSRIKYGSRKIQPSRAALSRAEAAVAALEEAQAREREKLAEEQAALNRKRRAMDAKHEKAMARMRAKRDAAEMKLVEATTK